MREKCITGKRLIVIYSLSFILPVFIAVLSFLNVNISINGTNTLLIYDMRAQLLALYGYISNGGPGYDTFMHNMSGGLGGGFFGTASLYISPLDLVYKFVPLAYLPDAIYIMTLLRIGFSGLFCSVFISKTSLDIKPALLVTFSCCYALMSYNFMYSMSPMWLDLVMLLPLLALSLEKIISGKKSLGFVILLSYSIFSDYYIAYMVSICLTLYCIFRLVENNESKKSFFKKFFMFAVHGLLSAGLAAFLIIPVVCDFGRGKLSEDSSAKSLVMLKNTLVEVLHSLAPSNYTSLNYLAPPNIFCGSIIVIFAVAWLVIGKKNIKSRITAFLIVCVYFLSFIFGPLDRIWHGFRDPIGFPIRYAFTFVFFMICFAVRGSGLIAGKSLKPNHVSIINLVVSLLVFYTFVELYINGSYILSRLAVEERYANRDEYNRYVDSMEGILAFADSIDNYDYARTIKNFRYSRFDGALFGYDGLERFSSSYNLALSDFLLDLGIGTSKHTISEYGVTPPVASLIDTGFIISWHKDYSAYYDYLGEYRGVSLYSNPNRLPLIFGTDYVADGPVEDFGDIPFENINLVYSELCNIEDLNETIFEKVDYRETERNPDDYYEKDTLGFADYNLTPTTDGSYWIYSEYIDVDDDRFKEAGETGEFNKIYPYAYYYVNGYKIDMYRNDEFSYCSDIGNLKSDNDYLISLDTSLSGIGQTYIYYYNSDVFEEIIGRLNTNAFIVEEIDSHGIKASGHLDKDSYLLISLPYETGYEIYIDGERTDYSSYRGALILVKASEGFHDIYITYIVPGLKIGILISLFTLLAVIVFFIPSNLFNRVSE